MILKYKISKNKEIQLYNEDCFKVLDDMFNHNIKVDMIICDLPYGKTKNKWDKPFDLNLLWEKYNKIIKETRIKEAKIPKEKINEITQMTLFL